MVLHTICYLSDEIQETRKVAEICLKCGTCCVIKHSCHAQYSSQFTPNHIYVYDCLGAEEPWKNGNIWLCVSCHKCEEVCPYETSPIKFIETMKHRAFLEGHVHPLVLNEVNQILTTGYAFPLTGASERQRSNLGLKLIRIRAVRDLSIIAKKTNLDDAPGEGQ